MLPWSRLDCNWFPWSLTLGRATTCYQMPMATVIVPAPASNVHSFKSKRRCQPRDFIFWSMKLLYIIIMNHEGDWRRVIGNLSSNVNSMHRHAICWYFPPLCPFHMSKVHIMAHTGIYSYNKYFSSLFCYKSRQAAWSCQLEKMELKLEKCCPEIGRRQESSRLQPLQKFSTCNYFKWPTFWLTKIKHPSLKAWNFHFFRSK